MRRLSTYLLAAVFLASAVAANLVIAAHGPSAAPYVAFTLVALDLVTRDALHDRLRRRELVVGMGALIVLGALLAYAAAPDAGDVALGSGLAFAAALTVDTVVYGLARRLPWLERSNLSNLAAAAVDSVVFYAVAFGSLDGAFAQWTAKVAGGLVVALLLERLVAVGTVRPDWRFAAWRLEQAHRQ